MGEADYKKEQQYILHGADKSAKGKKISIVKGHEVLTTRSMDVRSFNE